MQLSRPNKKQREPNLIGLINVIFLLLVFFLVTGTLTRLPFNDIDPIRTAQANPAQAPEDVLVIDDQGMFWFNGTIIEESTLHDVIASNDQDATDQAPMSLIVSRTLPVKGLRDALQRIQAYGVQSVRILSVE